MPSAPILWNKIQSSKSLNPVQILDPYTIPSEVAEQLRQRLQYKIQVAAKRFAKIAARCLDAIAGSSLYDDVMSISGRRAALIVELFRNSYFVSNAGSLDTLTFYRRLIETLKKNQPLVFEIGWGQAKRDAGQLRTPGASADLAEFLAISRIISLIKSIEILSDNKVTLRIITGGQRFRIALFIRPELDNAYNIKRQAFARWLSPDTDIEFDTIQSYWSIEDIKRRLDADEKTNIASTLSDEDFRFAIFSIDWYNVLETGSAHDIHLPSSIIDELKIQSKSGKTRFLRSAIAMIANPDIDVGQVNSPLRRSQLRVTSSWMSEVAKISADRYLRLGRLTPRNPQQSSHDDQPIIITVIEKSSRPDIPSIQLLGRKLGRTLPQHLTGNLLKGGSVAFNSLYLIENAVASIHIPDISENPMAVTSLSYADAINSLEHLQIFDDIEIS